MEREVIYVSGKITAPTPEGIEANIQKGIKKAADLAKEGYAPISPFGNSHNWHTFHEFEWRDYMEVDLPLLKRSDIVYMMDGWEQSRGARVEERYARLLRKRVIYENGEKHS